MRWLCLPAVFAAACAWGQSSVPSEQLVQAIVGAKIVVGNGTVLESGTIVMKDGVIVAVGLKVAVPAGAEIVDGKGLVVYPGFIDAFTSKGLKLPAASDPDAGPDITLYAPAAMRDADRKGIRPELRAAACLALTEDVRTPYLKAGFTTAMVCPSDGNLSGTGALVNLGGRPARDSVIVSDTGYELSLPTLIDDSKQGGDPSYPATPMGTIALVRQTLLDAQWYVNTKLTYMAGSAKRPPEDPALEALLPLLQKHFAAILDAPSKVWIERSLRVADEFHVVPMLLGGEEAWKLAEEIHRRETPVLVAVDFGIEAEPKKPPETKPTEAKPSETKPADTKPAEPIPYTDVKEDPEPVERTHERERLYLERVRNAFELDKAGIRFAFTSRGCKDLSEFMANLRRLSQEGLPKEKILRALTLTPAEIFGVDRRLGTIQAGKFADLTVMTGNFLEEKTKVKFAYVDGRKIDPNRAATPSAPHAPSGGEN